MKETTEVEKRERMNYVKVFSVVVIVFGLMIACESAPAWWDMILGSEYKSSGGYDFQSSYRQPKYDGKERYKKLCRVLNADNYAFPGKIPYPSAPLCPY